ncbi:beta-lactamase family protein [Skermania sp. ID1734]|uniref:serine hydrolase domain-containing protein n=1 Tax=Skermania sp. ID1734 TaxID=2597516 RepID=UPI00117FCACF|nr:serine hydrolase domain-containing protein [Skermania sp. ID1734]TSE00115.1 beta-lactamase family protein [Skermania sp. ID1734]
MRSLESIKDWPVDHAAGAVVSENGVVARAGDTTRVYRLASVTKLLAAYAVLVAAEEGAVELDQPAGPPGSTVRHLLSHASGLAMYEPTKLSEPGKRRIYSSAAFEVLAEHLADQTGIGFADYLREAVLTPLGMDDTDLTGSAGHGAHSSVDDLTAFLQELLDPKLISSETLNEAVSVQFPGLDGVVPGYGRQRPNDWGLGFELRDGKDPHWTAPTNSERTFGHFGQSGTFLWVDPQLRAGCVVLTDRDFDEWAKPLWTDFNAAVVGELAGSG